MVTAGSHIWTCPSCGRRVPQRAAACHCGMTRARAEELAAAQPATAPPPRPAQRGPTGADREAIGAMGTDVKLLLAACVLALVAGLGWLLFGPRPEPLPAVLGYVDSGPPPAPRPSPPPRPPFKLPWWK